jgi:PAS domain S-box-containing protein
MRGRFCFVAPYGGLLAAAEAAERETGYEIPCFSGELAAGLDFARAGVGSGCLGVISRGGTARLIRDKLSLPVIEVEVGALDLLRALWPGLSRGRKVAVIGYGNVIRSARAITDTLGRHIELIEIEREEEIGTALARARAAGARLVVGDSLASRKAAEAGLESSLIESGVESVAEAYRRAKAVDEAVRDEESKNVRLRAILDSVVEGVLSTDADGVVTLVNRSAELILGRGKDELIGLPASLIVPDSAVPGVLATGKAVQGAVSRIGGVSVAKNVLPVIVDGRVIGTVASFQDITRIQELEAAIRSSLRRRGLTAKKGFEDVCARSAPMREAVETARRYAGSDSTLLILGESGSGKEVFAQSVHNASRRADGPFVAVNCAALPPALIESELFGYAEGAFTGARKGGKPGVFELAHRGTLFLDEIGELEPPLQARILRALQEREVMRVGDDKIMPVDVRVLAATNRPVSELRDGTRFRKDLYYRLSILTLSVPPLRARPEDIEELADVFVAKAAVAHRREPPPLSARCRDILKAYSWPGNVRELQSVMERYALVVDDERQREAFLERELSGPDPCAGAAEPSLDLNGSLDEIERRVVRLILEQEGYNKSRAAERLQISRTTLNSKLESSK